MSRPYLPNRRAVVAGIAAAGAGISLARTTAFAAGQNVKIGVIMPITGPWARTGTLYVQGAELAARHINEQGGIKALGGATLELLVYDAGDSPETARNAAQRMVAQHNDLSAITGAWLSSFTLAVSEVTERAGIPLVTVSAADILTERGFKYIFRTVPTGNAWVEQLMPGVLAVSQKALGRLPKTAAMIADSSPSPQTWSKILRENILPQKEIELLVDEVFTPPIADTTALVQQVRRAQPDIMFNIATNTPDLKLFIDKMTEFNLRIPTFFVASALASSEIPQLISHKALDGMLVAINNWGTPARQSIVDDFKKAYGEPFMAQDSANAYGEMWLIKEAVEQAGVADNEKVAEALRNIDLPTDDGVGQLFYGGRIKFDQSGNRVGAGMMLLQWQSGQPVTVYPPEMTGGAEPIWPQ